MLFSSWITIIGINKLLKIFQNSANIFPIHLKINFNNENTKLYFKSFYYIFCSIIHNKNTCDIKSLNIIIIKIEDTKILNDENLNKKILLKNGERLA